MKHRVSYLYSLMQFNKRVLGQGFVDPDKKYSIEDLKKLLFFNKIFLSNMEEVFEKYDTFSIIDDYIECIKQYASNINLIINKFMKITPCIITNKDSFEKRFATEIRIKHDLINRKFRSIYDVNYQFNSNQLYFISRFKNGNILISTIDPSKDIFDNPISCNNGKFILYWLTDDCIRDFIKRRYNVEETIVIKPSISNSDNTITKVEYNGNSIFMKQINSIFGNVLILQNPFLLVKNIDNIISPYCPSEEIKQDVRTFDINKLFTQDQLIEYPSDSFASYINFLQCAFSTGKVKTIYMTLYRVGNNPKLYYFIKNAIAHGIKVIINIELCASNEDINYMWLKEFRDIGAKIITYQSGKTKVHCKATLIEFDDNRSLIQIGTGNYHTNTTEQYTDLSLITSNENLCSAVKKLFIVLENDIDMKFTDNLLVTRFNAREVLYKLIDAEGNKGKDGYITIKCNSLDDDEVIDHLDKAAINGCNINIIVRSVCTWLPDQLNYNVTIKSIIWDKLEHSRVFAFGNENPIIYIGSLDLVTHKLDNRIETMIKIKDPNIEVKLVQYLNRYITSIRESWRLTNSGTYIKE